MGKHNKVTPERETIMMQLRTEFGLDNKKIAEALNYDPVTVKKHIGDDKPKEVKEESKDIMNIMIGIAKIGSQLDKIEGIVGRRDDNGYRITQSFEGLGFKDKNGTFVSDGIQVNMNNRKIFYHYTNDKGNMNTVILEPNVIECIWTEMVKRGWNWFK